MSNYDIRGTIFYNTALKPMVFNRHTPAFVRGLLNVIEPTPDMDARACQIWRDQLKHSRDLARAGIVHALSVRPGNIAARIIHPANTPAHTVKISAGLADETLWRDITAHAARELTVAAQLSRAVLPEPWMSALSVARAALTMQVDDSTLSLDQPPDVFAAAVWAVFAQLVQADPWLWVLFRGQTREGLLDQLRQARAAQQQKQNEALTGIALDPGRFWAFDALPDATPAPANDLHILKQLRSMPGDVRLGRRRMSIVLRKAFTKKSA